MLTALKYISLAYLEMSPMPDNQSKKYLKYAVLGFSIFLAITGLMFFRSFREANGSLTFTVIYARSPLWAHIMSISGFIGSPAVIATLAVIGITTLAWLRQLKDAVYLALAMLLAPAFLIIVKAILSQNPSFSLDEVSSLNKMLTYPSDYTFGAAVFFTSLALVLEEKIHSLHNHRRNWIWVVSLLIVALIGISRIFHGRNYPTDVLAAICIGFAWAFFAKYSFDRNLAKRFYNNKYF